MFSGGNMIKIEKNILVAFLLNLSFSIFEFIGGSITNSYAIISDSIHDICDAMSIGISYILERKSHHKPDNKYTFGYLRYSVLGGLITTSILLVGSILIIINSIKRIFNPVVMNYQKMILIAIFGVIVNFIAAYKTKEGDSLNQKSVNLHMLEDVLGWIVILIGSVIMKFTNLSILDPIMSIIVSCYVLYHSLKNYKEILDLFLEKIPNNINIKELKKHLLEINGIIDIHHIHVWSMDGNENFATMHVVSNVDKNNLKQEIREELKEHGISHVTIELENELEKCLEPVCKINHDAHTHHHHHHH